MKLKLQKSENEIQILFASEQIEPNHVQILNAGLNRMYADGADVIVLNLLEVSETSIETLKAISMLKAAASIEGVQLLIVSEVAGIGDGKTVEEVLLKVGSPMARLVNQESRFQNRVKRLEQRKSELEKKLGAADKQGSVKDLKRDNTVLKAKIKNLEIFIDEMLNSRKEIPDEVTSQEDSLQKLLSHVDLILREDKLLS